MTPFATRLLAWYDAHGRSGLPWQPTTPAPRDPYPIWVSEIMLQQTQVATVIPYFERFMARFPTLQALAEAPLDAVLAHWGGLGYYARGRNLHKAARQALTEHGGLPREIDALQALPGIGRSTAGAILAVAYRQHHAILDGNVKRVLCRFHAIDGWPGQTAIAQRLWALAESHTPVERVDAYTQAIMDLGATLCRRNRPECTACPQQGECRALAEGRVAQLPNPKPRKSLPEREATLLIIEREDGGLLLEQRPPSGIWGGLWSLPELTQESEAFCRAAGLELLDQTPLAPLRHTFSHFHLAIQPLHLRVREAKAPPIMEPGTRLWYKPDTINQLGLPSPIRTILDRLTTNP